MTAGEEGKKAKKYLHLGHAWKLLADYAANAEDDTDDGAETVRALRGLVDQLNRKADRYFEKSQRRPAV